MKVWLQSSDFSSHECELDLHESIKLFRRHDWRAEQVIEEQLASAGKENCPAGIGLIHESGRILHICSQGATALYHFHRPKKFLGLFSTETRTITHEGYNTANISGLLTSFFNEQWEEVERAN